MNARETMVNNNLGDEQNHKEEQHRAEHTLTAATANQQLHK